MSLDYGGFLETRRHLTDQDGFDPEFMPDYLFPFQRDLVTWAVRQGRAAIFADCGMGKTPMQLVWAQNIVESVGPVLVATPLAVAGQTVREAAKFGIEASVSRDGTVAAPITITNYDRLHLFDKNDYAAMVCDESSAIKAFDGKRRQVVTEFMRQMRYRLLCTATAAPNDYIELGTSSEALGYLGHMDMLNRFFTNSDLVSHPMRLRWGKESEWRFKGHAEVPFWQWVSSWARALRKPSDLGYSDDGFDLPELTYSRHVIEAATPMDGRLFDLPAFGLTEQRQEARRTITERCEKVAVVLADADPGIAWCHLNDESDLLTSMIDGAVQVRGSDTVEEKEEALAAFGAGEIRTLVTKPSIAGWGLNWQHCHRMAFFPSHSYEQFYQAVRRCWRFGQDNDVEVDIVTTTGGLDVLRNLERKSRQADAMFDALTEHMREAASVDRSVEYTNPVEVPSWLS